MTLLSLPVLVLLPAVLIVYYGLPDRFRRDWLLICSLLCCTASGKTCLIHLLAVSCVSFHVAKKISENPGGRLSGIWLWIGSTFIIGSFLVFSFLRSQGARLPSEISAVSTVIYPFGIAYFSLKAVSYLIDVYHGKIKGAWNFRDFLLYLCYFPSFAQGPISRYSDFSVAKCTEPSSSKESIPRAVFLILWGLFKKLVIADRLAVALSIMHEEYSGIGSIVLVSCLLYSIRLYADFSGYMDIIRGVSKLFGISLEKNFDDPLSAVSVRDFWRRWHITLGSWLRDYVYIPLGGNKKGLAVTCLNTLAVFAVSGLWHGVSANYLAWGVLHGLVVSAETIVVKCGGRWLMPTELSKPVLVFRRCLTFLIVSFLWVFFFAHGLRDALSMVHAVFQNFNISAIPNHIFDFGLSSSCISMLGVAVLTMLLGEQLQRDGIIGRMINIMSRPVRYIASGIIILMIAVIGYYGPDTTGMLIYVQF